MLAFNLEDMNHLVYVDARVPKRMQGPCVPAGLRPRPALRQ